LKALLCFSLCLFCSLCFGQLDAFETKKDVIEKTNTVDTTFIKDISDKFIIKVNRDSKVDFYTIKTGEFPLVSIAPNISNNYSIGLDYKFIGVSIGFPKKWYENTDSNYLKGKSTAFSIGFSLFFNKFLQTFNYNMAQGYYVKESKYFEPNWQEGITPYIQFPNYKSRRFSTSTLFIMNGNKFSYRSFSQQTQIQKKSAGSLIPSLTNEYLYTSDKVEGFSDKKYKSKLSSTLFVGYQYNWVIIKNLNFSSGIYPGYGWSYVKYFEPNNLSENTYWEQKWALNFNANLNYQWKNLFFGVQFSSLNNFTKEDESKINNSINYENIYIGYQFNAPKRIEKYVNWVEKKLF
jgi:hypothetical protein